MKHLLIPRGQGGNMKTFDVIIKTGATTHRVVARARYHEEAEREGCFAANVKWEDVEFIMTTPREEAPCLSAGKTD